MLHKEVLGLGDLRLPVGGGQLQECRYFLVVKVSSLFLEILFIGHQLGTGKCHSACKDGKGREAHDGQVRCTS